MRTPRRRRIFGRREGLSSAMLATIAAIAFIGVGWLVLIQPDLVDSETLPVSGSQNSNPAPAYGDLSEDPHSERIPATDSRPGQVIDVELTDDAIRPNPIAAEPGTTVRYRITNRGSVAHEFRLTNGHDVEEHVVSDALTEEPPDHPNEEAAIVVLVDPGNTREVDVEMPSDTTVFTIAACLIRGHYGAGMWTPVVDEPGEPAPSETNA